MERRVWDWPARVGVALLGLLAGAGFLGVWAPGPPAAPRNAVAVVRLVRVDAPPPARTAPVVRQVVSVVATDASRSTAWLTLWTRRSGSAPWRRDGAPIRVRLGAAGVTRHPREGLAATPLGTFPLTRALGRDTNAEQLVTRLPYHRLRPGDGWNTAPGAGYNRLGHTGELWAARNAWARAAVLIDYNVDHPRARAGSGFFVHVAAGGPTRGCVALPPTAMLHLLRWLDPAAHPRISIALGTTPPGLHP
jgi:L,D-peptidoglycan transpeptidase YkuD (ErfK/YbiS/YcfS/YnhG family)